MMPNELRNTGKVKSPPLFRNRPLNGAASIVSIFVVAFVVVVVVVDTAAATATPSPMDDKGSFILFFKYIGTQQ